MAVFLGVQNSSRKRTGLEDWKFRNFKRIVEKALEIGL
jgi:hypothetical protein